MALIDFIGADKIIEFAKSYYDVADNENNGTAWSEGFTYRSSNTPTSLYCEAGKTDANSMWVALDNKKKYYKAIDCSTFVGLCVKGYGYDVSPYVNETKFKEFRVDRMQTNKDIPWALSLPRTAADQGKFFKEKGWIIEKSNFGNAANNFSGLKKGDIIFWAKKNSDGSWNEPNRYMNISHVGFVYGNINGKLSTIETTNLTDRYHTLSDGKKVNVGVTIRTFETNDVEEMIFAARIQYVPPVNEPPKIWNVAKYITKAGASVGVKYSTSDDRAIVKHELSIDNGLTYEVVNPTVGTNIFTISKTYSGANLYECRIRVTDDTGQSSISNMFTIEVVNASIGTGNKKSLEVAKRDYDNKHEDFKLLVANITQDGALDGKYEKAIFDNMLKEYKAALAKYSAEHEKALDFTNDNKMQSTVKDVDIWYYLSTSKTELTGGKWQTEIPTSTTDKFIWTKTVTTYYSGSTIETTPSCIINQGGREVREIREQYYLSESPIELVGSVWTELIPTWEEGKYIWTRNVITCMDWSTIVTKGVCIVGRDEIDKIKDTTVKKVDVMYYLSTSQTSLVGGSWSTEAPTWTNGKYMWSKTVTTYSSGATMESNPTCIAGAKGTNGVGIKSMVEEYYQSTSPTSQVGGTWSSQPPQWVDGKYMWTRTVITYTDNTSTTTTPICTTGQRGQQGIQGIQGEQGEQGVKGETGQTSYFHIKYSPVSNPTADQMTETPDTYIGTYVDFSMTDSTDPTKYKWARFQGLQGSKGEQGIPGVNGADGNTTYLHIKYSDDGGKTFTANNGETVGAYIGTCTDFNLNDPSTVASYTWAKIKGEQGQQGLQGVQGERGEQGIPGVDGADGKTSYFHIKYSPVENPTSAQMTETPNTYIGTYVDYVEADSTDPLKYKWARFEGMQGEQGDRGIPGLNGADGRTSYLHIKYSNDGGLTFTANNGETEGAYIGTCTDFNSIDPSVVSAYKWAKIKGEQGQQGIQGIQGEQGIQGIPGSNGKTSYFHIKYSSVSNPTSSSQMTETPNTYIGTYVDYVEADSTDPTKYTWSRFQGLQGATGQQGIPGVNGADGRTTYLHIKYSNDGGKTFTGNSGEDPGDYIGQCTDFNLNDPTTVGAYKWTKIKGEQGAAGTSVSSIDVEYANSTSYTTAPTTGWQTTAPAWEKNKYIWSRTKTVLSTGSTTYSKAVCISGASGADGATGSTGKGVSTIAEEYYKSTSKTTQTGGSWTTTPPLWSSGTYMWTRSKVTYTDGTTSYTTPICDNAWEAVNEIEVGGRNLLPKKSLSLANGATGSFDEASNTWTITATPGSTVWGRGLHILSSPHNIVIPYGKGAIYSFEIKVPKQVEWNTDVNNTSVSGSAWSGNDNDDQSKRKTSARTISRINEWVKCWSYIENTNSLNTNKIDIKDANSSFGIVTTNETANIIFSIRNFKVELGNIPTDWSPAPEDIDESIGATVKSVDVMYYLSTSSTSLAGGSWQTTAPTWVNGRYMWSKTVTTLGNGTVKESAATCIAGAKGDTGASGSNGSDGVGVKSIVEEYGMNTSKTTPPTSWGTVFPTWIESNFIWTRSKITYTNNSVVYTTPYCDTSWEQVMDKTNNKVDKSQTAVFNALTNNGQTQGIYLSSSKVYINGEYIKANSIAAGTLKADALRGLSFFTAADSSASYGYAFRIYEDGRVYSKKTIQVYGSAEDGQYSQLMPGRVTATDYIQAPGITTDNNEIYICMKGRLPGVSDTTLSVKLSRNAENTYSYFMPCWNSTSSTGGIRLGATNGYWNICYSKNGVSTGSDRRMKENIKYVDREVTDIQKVDMLKFITEEYLIAQYNYIGDVETKLSGVAQDLLVDCDGTESKVGQTIVNNQELLESTIAGEEGGMLGINQTQLLNVTIGAFQEYVRVTDEKMRIMSEKIEKLVTMLTP